jgi:hypothetical protein
MTSTARKGPSYHHASLRDCEIDLFHVCTVVDYYHLHMLAVKR